MEAIIFVRQLNATEYSKLGKRKFSILPRQEEYFSAEWEGSTKYFQVIGIHHSIGDEQFIELYAVQSQPSWLARKGRAIGFGH